MDQAKKKDNTAQFGHNVSEYVEAVTRAATDQGRRETRITDSVVGTVQCNCVSNCREGTYESRSQEEAYVQVITCCEAASFQNW